MAFVLEVVEFFLHERYPYFEWGFAHYVRESNQQCLVLDLFLDQ